MENIAPQFFASTVIRESIMRLFAQFGIDTLQNQWILSISYLVFSVVVAIIGLLITRLIHKLFIKPIIKASKTYFDDALDESGAIKRFTYAIPFLILYFMYPAIFDNEDIIYMLLRKAFSIALLIPLVLTISAFLNGVNMYYGKLSFAKQRPIKGYIQIGKIFIIIAAVLLAISIIFNISVVGLLGGLGAVSAILLLIFKDSILALTASAHLSLNKMVQIGDWIEIPEHKIDGEVVDMNLYSMRIQNWNKTIVSIPIYNLISNSFINWRGMQEAGGRRIKRSIYIDMQSICFCDAQMIQKLKKYKLLQEYLAGKEEEIALDNKQKNIDSAADPLSSRAMTNIGTFRAYTYRYLINHPHINHTLTTMVRQLQPTSHGIPIEIYGFSAIQKWEEYETIQSDIFDHLLAVLPIFGLRVFQSLGGHDFQNIGKA